MKTTLYIVRHGQTQSNKLEIVMGDSDLPLNLTGEVNAKNVGRKLKELKVKPDAVYSSVLQRAAKTADIIAKELNYTKPIDRSQELREINYGDIEGISFKQARETIPAYKSKEVNFVFPNGESYAQLYKRVTKEIERIMSENQGKTILIVSHLRPLQCILCHYNKWNLHEELLNTPSHERIEHEYIGKLTFNGSKFEKYENISEVK